MTLDKAQTRRETGRKATGLLKGEDKIAGLHRWATMAFFIFKLKCENNGEIAMKRLLLVALVGIVLLSSAPVMAQDGFYVIVGGGGVGTKITSLPYTILNSGFYYITGTLTYSGTGNAITVSSDNVTIDLMGFSLTCTTVSNSSTGIRLDGRNNVEIRNGTVRGFYTGIYDKYGTGSNFRIINVRANDATTAQGVGIYLAGKNNLVKACTASNNGHIGILVNAGTISDCVVCDNGNTGIRLFGPGSVIGNVVFNNSTHNFHLGSGVATAIIADRNSALGCNPNYYLEPSTTGEQWGINAGAP
jgi:hypothetical protein